MKKRCFFIFLFLVVALLGYMMAQEFDDATEQERFTALRQKWMGLFAVHLPLCVSMCVFLRDLIGLLPEDSANCNHTNNQPDLGQRSSVHFKNEDEEKKLGGPKAEMRKD